MSEMIERAAKAIKDRVPSDYGMTQKEAEMYARAAIEAMREPTYTMIAALGVSIRSHPEAYSAYQGMIDAALSVSDEHTKCRDYRLGGEALPARPTPKISLPEGKE